MDIYDFVSTIEQDYNCEIFLIYQVGSKSIKIDNKPINGFATSVKEYTIEVESSTENIDIKAQLSDEKGATLVENFGSRTVKLEYGTNKVL